MSRINVALIDDNQDFLQKITTFLNSSKDILVVATATTKEQALKLPEIYDIDIMLIDTILKDHKCDGILVTNQIFTNCLGKIKIIMLTAYNNKELIKKSFLAGAVYYILKTNYIILPNVIRNVYNNNFPVETVIREYADFMKDKILKSDFLLSDTEILVYRLMEEGNTKAKILEQLHVTESTYKKHVNKILKKFHETRMKKAIDKFHKTILTRDLDK